MGSTQLKWLKKVAIACILMGHGTWMENFKGLIELLPQIQGRMKGREPGQKGIVA